MADASDPWQEQASHIVPHDFHFWTDEKHKHLIRHVRQALAWAYEQGYSQGRLYEIERARGEQQSAIDVAAGRGLYDHAAEPNRNGET